jgi:predicted phosphoribosyltransferase
MSLFEDRADAGRRLAEKLTAYRNRHDVIVLALPRGGVPVAYEVALALDAPLDIFLVRKLGVPGQEELAMGAIASGNVQIINQDVVEALGISEETIDAVAREEERELERRERSYRDNRPATDVRGHTVILIDDGLATGASMAAAVAGLRALHPAQIVIAVPIASVETCEMFEEQVDAIICAETPHPFRAVGVWYDDFSQTTDDEVRTLLATAAELHSEHT